MHKIHISQIAEVPPIGATLLARCGWHQYEVSSIDSEVIFLNYVPEWAHIPASQCWDKINGEIEIQEPQP